MYFTSIWVYCYQENIYAYIHFITVIIIIIIVTYTHIYKLILLYMRDRVGLPIILHQ